jgi:hypothetical protein
MMKEEENRRGGEWEMGRKKRNYTERHRELTEKEETHP